MRTAKLRVAVALMAVATAVIGGPTSVSAHHTASGTFYYEDLLGGSSTITDPTPGVCYLAGTLAFSATNNTNAPATIYSDDSCSEDGVVVDPGNNAPTSFRSVRFSSP